MKYKALIKLSCIYSSGIENGEDYIDFIKSEIISLINKIE